MVFWFSEASEQLFERSEFCERWKPENHGVDPKGSA